MRIDHLIVGARDVAASAEFYCNFLGFLTTPDDPGADGGMVLSQDQCELLILPFNEARLPNPAHFAFRVESVAEFEGLLSRAIEMGLHPRSMPPKNSKPGVGVLSRGGKQYKIFYVFDPAGSNVEVMVGANLN